MITRKWNRVIRLSACGTVLALGAATNFALAQDEPPAQQSDPATGGWRRATDQPPRPQGFPSYSHEGDPSQGQRPADDPGQYGPPPAHLTIQPGTFVTVRLNQALSSDRNQPGDAFSATLVRPVVVDGIVVAQRGQTVGGRVAEAKKAGRVSGVSRLGLQLTDLTLVDGQPMTIQSQLVSRNGGTSQGRDAAAIGGTTAFGAAVGAAAAGGTGAAIGAGAGMVASVIGVLVTRGRPTIIYPESVLTFRVEAPVTISTARAPQAFQYIDPNEYQRAADERPLRPRPACVGYGCGAPPPYYGYYGGYYGPGYSPYWGGVGVYWGPGFYWGRGYHRWRRW